MPNLGTLGWAYISGSTVAIKTGADQRVPFFSGSSVLTGSSNITYNDSNKTFSVTGSILATAVGTITTVDTTTVTPTNYNAVMYGPITVSANGSFKVSANSNIKIKDIGDV